MKRRDEVSVGILITVAVAVLLLGTLWLVRGGLKSGYPLHTRFEWGQNLKQGQPVLLAGVSVGYVGDVTLRRDGYLEVLLRIDDKFQVPKGSKATVKAIGIFGDVSVALTPPTPVPAASYAPDDTVPPGPPSADINEIMDHVDSIGRSVSVLTKALEVEVVQAGTLKDIHRAMAAAATFSVQLQSVMAEQNRNFTATLESFRQGAQHLSNVADSVQIAATLANTRRITENTARLAANVDSTNAQLQKLLTVAEKGNGTIGKLLADSLLYSDSRQLLQTTTRAVARMDSLLADVKANPKKYFTIRVF
jgi:phospholipid/cholesterol/gamma-HCH transport system substrate-binding protein